MEGIHRVPIGRAFVERCGGWRMIYSAREIRRGKRKGLFEVEYVDLRGGQSTFKLATVSDYKTMEGELIHARKERE